jgi:pimeloyl-ACP methyl ester carboxylesterase
MDSTTETLHKAFPAAVTGSGPALLLAPGAGGRGNFALVLEELAEGHTVIAPEYPGMGDTPPPTEPLTLDGMADSLVASATEAGIERFTLVGFSMGTAVAVRAAARHPERVAGVVLTAALVRGDNRTRLFLDLVHSLLARGDAENVVRFTALSGFGPAFVNDMDEDQLEGFLTVLSVTADPASVPLSEVVRTADLRPDLARISVPTLVVCARHDALTPGHSRELADGIADAEYAEIDSGHVVLAERPEEWLETVGRFLAERRL